MVYFFAIVVVVFNSSDLSVLFRYFMNEPDIGNEYMAAVVATVFFFIHSFVHSLHNSHQCTTAVSRDGVRRDVYVPNGILLSLN